MHVRVLRQRPAAAGLGQALGGGGVVESSWTSWRSSEPVSKVSNSRPVSNARGRSTRLSTTCGHTDGRELEEALVAAGRGAAIAGALAVDVDGHRRAGVGPHVVIEVEHLAAAVVLERRPAPVRLPRSPGRTRSVHPATARAEAWRHRRTPRWRGTGRARAWGDAPMDRSPAGDGSWADGRARGAARPGRCRARTGHRTRRSVLP